MDLDPRRGWAILRPGMETKRRPPIIFGVSSNLKRAAGKAILAGGAFAAGWERSARNRASHGFDPAGNADIQVPAFESDHSGSPGHRAWADLPTFSRPLVRVLCSGLAHEYGEPLSHPRPVESERSRLLFRCSAASFLDQRRWSDQARRLGINGSRSSRCGPALLGWRGGRVAYDWKHRFCRVCSDKQRLRKWSRWGSCTRSARPSVRVQLHAFTGLREPGSQALATHRLPSCKLVQDDLPRRLQETGFHEATGANVWLVRPNDPSVFVGASLAEGLRSPIPFRCTP